MNRYLPNLITHTAASAGTNGADQTNNTGRGLHVVIDVTAGAGTSPTITATVEGKDPASGKYYTLLASTAIDASTPSTAVLKVYPGLPATANASANDILPMNWRVKTAIGGTTPTVTAKVSAHVID